MPLLYISAAFLTGILISPLSAWPWWLLAIPVPLFLAALIVRSLRRTFILAAVCLLALAGGALRYQSSLHTVDSTTLQYYNGRGDAQITGSVSDYPQKKGSSLEFKFSASKISISGNVTEITGNALVHVPFYRQYHYGDLLELRGKPQEPQPFEDFDYNNFLANQGIYSVIYFPGAELLDTGGGIAPMAWIYGLRERLAASLSTCLPEPQGSLASAILLGLRGSLPDSLLQSFYATGTTHLIAISGMNLTIVLGMIFAGAIWLFGRKNGLYIWISLALIWLYTMLTGLPATMVRATIMGSVFLLAELLGRQRSGPAALALAGALMAAVDPAVLRDVSFQLSFLSMLGLVYITPYLTASAGPLRAGKDSKYMYYLKSFMVISFGATIAAVAATWPITAMNFHAFSLVSAPATIFAMPSFPGIMITSMITSLAGIIWQPLGIVIGWAAWLLLSYFLWVVQVFSSIPVAYIQNVQLQPCQAIIYYVVLAGLLQCLHYRQAIIGFIENLYLNAHGYFSTLRLATFRPFVPWLLAILLTANILISIGILMLPDGNLHVTVFDVGQGEAILIRTPDGQNILVDSGPDPTSTSTQLGKTLPFWDRKIDLLILTQLQADHISGTLDLLHKYAINSAGLPPSSSQALLPTEIINALNTGQVRLYTLHDGHQFNPGRDIRLDVLNPPPGLFTDTSDDINNNSIVLKLTYRDVSFLLTADIGMDAEMLLAGNRADLRSSVLKVAHHGSRGSTSDEFLSIVKPSAAVISAGAVNRFGHPHRETLDRLNAVLENSNIFITANRGNVEFITDGYRLWYRAEKAANIAP
jgi:competence protein ComEC